MRLQDKVAVITGGANGIGKETALLFAKNGAKLVLADFDAAAGAQTLEELRAGGADVEFVQTDVSNREDVQRMVDITLERFSRIDILINNAGITRDGFLTKLDPQHWDQVIAINLTGVFNCTQLVALKMMEQGSGVILNAASVVALYGNIGQTNYDQVLGEGARAEGRALQCGGTGLYRHGHDRQSAGQSAGSHAGEHPAAPSRPTVRHRERVSVPRIG